MSYWDQMPDDDGDKIEMFILVGVAIISTLILLAMV